MTVGILTGGIVPPNSPTAPPVLVDPNQPPVYVPPPVTTTPSGGVVMVYDTIGDGTGGTTGKATITIALVADDGSAVYMPSKQMSVLSRKVIEIDERAEGRWSADLIPNSLLEPAAANHYEAIRYLPDGTHDKQPLKFVVPDVNQAVWVRDLIAQAAAADAAVAASASSYSAALAQIAALQNALATEHATNTSLTGQVASQQQQIFGLQSQLATAQTTTPTTTAAGDDPFTYAEVMGE